MQLTRDFLFGRLGCVILMSLAASCASPARAPSGRGQVANGIYTAPNGSFTVRIPNAQSPSLHVAEAADAESRTASFNVAFGEVHRIDYWESSRRPLARWSNPQQPAGGLDWTRDAALGFIASQTPGVQEFAVTLRRGSAEFGSRMSFAAIRMKLDAPGNVSTHTRGVLVFEHGAMTYVLHYSPPPAAADGRSPEDLLGALQEFRNAISFPEMGSVGEGGGKRDGLGRAYSIQFPGHVLRFEVPEKFAREIAPMRVEQAFATDDAAFKRNGFRSIAGWTHDFAGLPWQDARGSFTFNLMVIARDPAIEGEILTPEGLERYVRAWVLRSGHVFTFQRDELNGLPAFRRGQDEFAAGQVAQPRESAIYSIPLTPDYFLDVAFILREWRRGSAASWRPEAEAIRDTIIASLRLEPKSS